MKATRDVCPVCGFAWAVRGEKFVRHNRHNSTQPCRGSGMYCEQPRTPAAVDPSVTSTGKPSTREEKD
jgi:hypothetical protein